MSKCGVLLQCMVSVWFFLGPTPSGVCPETRTTPSPVQELMTQYIEFVADRLLTALGGLSNSNDPETWVIATQHFQYPLKRGA